MKKKSEEVSKSAVWVLFSPEGELDNIRKAFSGCLELEQEISGNSAEIRIDNFSMEITVLLPSMGKEEDAFIRNQKSAVCAFFSQIQVSPEKNDIKLNLCHQIQTAKSYICIELKTYDTKEDWEDDLDYAKDLLMDVAEAVEGILVIEEGTMALGVVDGEGDVLLDEHGFSAFTSYFPFMPEENPKLLAGCTDRQKSRRNRNMNYLFEKGIYVCELPVNKDEDTASIRSKEEAVRRTLGLLVVSLYSEAMLNPQEAMSVAEAREFIGRVMQDFAIGKPEEILTPAELAYLQDDAPKEETQIEYSWNYEHLYTLEWVLGLAEWNDPVEICDVGQMVRNLRDFDSVEELCQKTSMRTDTEILDKADLIYCMDWAAVDARIHGMNGPAGLEHGVVQARHKTLNWMICFQDDEWDDVETPT